MSCHRDADDGDKSMIHYLSLVSKFRALRNPWESGMQDTSFA